MPGRRRGRKKGKAKARVEGVVSRSELREAFLRAWRVCGHPKHNPECWRRILRGEWSDV